MPIAETTPDRTRYEALRLRGAELLHDGDLAGSEDLHEQALEEARRLDEPDLVDRAYCNLAAVIVETGNRATVLPELRRILMSNRDPENCRLAAYHIARAYELAKQYKKGLFYASIARDLSTRIDRPSWIASSHNQMGSLLLADSFFDAACGHYEQALELMPDTPDVPRALILDNLGYCRLVQGRHAEGFRNLFTSLRTLRRLGARLWEVHPHLDLCFGYLEIGRLRSAVRHGAQALALAEETGDVESTKNAMYLLGEAANLSGDRKAAYEQFETLQKRFFPGEGYLANFLLAVDVRRLINLKA